MRSVWAAALLLRRLRSEFAIELLIVVLVGATAFVFAAAPRVLNGITDQALQQAVEGAPATQRNIALTLSGSLPAGAGGGVGVIRTYGDGLASQVPASIGALVDGRLLRVTTLRFSVEKSLPYDTRISLRYQDGLQDATRLVTGRWPVDRGMPLHPLPIQEFGGPEPPPDTGPTGPTTIIEVALAKGEADALSISLGDRLPIVVDGTDPLSRSTDALRFFGFKLAPAELEVVGLYEPLDRASDYWAGDAGLAEATFGGPGLDPTIAYATAYVPAAAYGNLWTYQLPFRYEWDLIIDPHRLDASQVGQLEVDVRRLGQIGSTDPSAAGLRVVTALPRILDRYAAEQAAAEAVLTIAAIGPFGLAGGAMVMIALLLVRRRTVALALARGRGASTSLILGTQLWESLLIAGGSAVAGLLLAVALVPARASPLSPALAVAVAVAATVLLVGVTWSAARRPLDLVERDDAQVLRVSPRRLVLELTVVVISVAATLLLKDRGLNAGGVGGSGGGQIAGTGSDPLLASVPVLSGLAAGIVAARLYPLPIRALGWLAARRRDVVPVLGLRTVARQAASANVPLLVLMLTAAFAAFSSVVASSLDRGQLVASYLTVGADYRVEMVDLGPLPPAFAPAAIGGIDVVAPGDIDPSAPFANVPGQPATVYLQAIDPATFDRVTAGTPADPAWPAAFLAAPQGSGLGTAANPIPAILSTTLPSGSRDMALGDTFQMTADGRSMTFRLVERRSSFAGIVDRATFAVVPYNWVQAAIGRTLSPSAVWLRGTSGAGAPLAAEVAGLPGTIRLTSRYATYSALKDTPLEASIGGGFLLALALGGVYMALTIVGAMVLSAARRTRDLAYLRTLGVSAPQALGLTIVEHATPVLLAIVPGVALGIGIAALCLPGLGLATFVGPTGVPFFVDWPGLAIVIAGIVAVVVVAITAGSWLARRARLVDALRLDER